MTLSAPGHAQGMKEMRNSLHINLFYEKYHSLIKNNTFFYNQFGNNLPEVWKMYAYFPLGTTKKSLITWAFGYCPQYTPQTPLSGLRASALNSRIDLHY